MIYRPEMVAQIETHYLVRADAPNFFTAVVSSADARLLHFRKVVNDELP